MSKFRPATLAEYLAWYRSYYEKGGHPTHLYDYPWSRWNFLFTNSSFRLGGECGANARHIITGPGVEWVGGDRGHNGIYFTDGTVNSHVVPMFSDPEFSHLPGYKDLYKKVALEELQWQRHRETHELQRLEAAQYSDLPKSRHCQTAAQPSRAERWLLAILTKSSTSSK